MPMKEPKCQHCGVRHWPKDGCGLLSLGCVDCQRKDLEIKALQEKVQYLETDDLQVLARRALARREYHKKYMRKVRANA